MARSGWISVHQTLNMFCYQGRRFDYTRRVRFQLFDKESTVKVEVTKALAALQPLFGKDNVEIVTLDGRRIRGIVRSMKTTQALTAPSVKIEQADGGIIKIPFPQISEIVDHNQANSPLPKAGRRWNWRGND